MNYIVAQLKLKFPHILNYPKKYQKVWIEDFIRMYQKLFPLSKIKYLADRNVRKLMNPTLPKFKLLESLLFESSSDNNLPHSNPHNLDTFIIKLALVSAVTIPALIYFFSKPKSDCLKKCKSDQNCKNLCELSQLNSQLDELKLIKNNLVDSEKNPVKQKLIEFHYKNLVKKINDKMSKLYE